MSRLDIAFDPRLNPSLQKSARNKALRIGREAPPRGRGVLNVGAQVAI